MLLARQRERERSCFGGKRTIRTQQAIFSCRRSGLHNCQERKYHSFMFRAVTSQHILSVNLFVRSSYHCPQYVRAFTNIVQVGKEEPPESSRPYAEKDFSGEYWKNWHQVDGCLQMSPLPTTPTTRQTITSGGSVYQRTISLRITDVFGSFSLVSGAWRESMLVGEWRVERYAGAKISPR